MNNKQKDLFNKSLEHAPYRQILVSCLWWYIFRPQKFKDLLWRLELGFEWKFAYEYTYNQ